ncbi:hypothetical protein R1flu_009878 [Riccia fluitans]|uniref:Uncharacterized protein n=1 Tax=Riccia fluitans TaxID=41844 RepID=A0ABD1Z3F0_9MARC
MDPIVKILAQSTNSRRDPRRSVVQMARRYVCSYLEHTMAEVVGEGRKSKNQWRQLQEKALDVNASFQVTHGLLETIDEAIRTKKNGGPLVYILFSITNSISKDQNQAFFHNKSQVTPLNVSLEHAQIEIEGSFINRSSAIRWQQGLKTLQEINNMLPDILMMQTTRGSTDKGERI